MKTFQKAFTTTVLLAACAVSNASFAQDSGVRESTDQQKISDIERHAQMLSQTQPGTSQRMNDDANIGARSSMHKSMGKKKAHAKDRTRKYQSSSMSSGDSGTTGNGAAGMGDGMKGDMTNGMGEVGNGSSRANNGNAKSVSPNRSGGPNSSSSIGGARDMSSQ